MLIDRHRPFAAAAAGLVTTLLLVWLDGALAIERLRLALAGL